MLALRRGPSFRALVEEVEERTHLGPKTFHYPIQPGHLRFPTESKMKRLVAAEREGIITVALGRYEPLMQIGKFVDASFADHRRCSLGPESFRLDPDIAKLRVNRACRDR